jgi:hypothetical protein
MKDLLITLMMIVALCVAGYILNPNTTQNFWATLAGNVTIGALILITVILATKGILLLYKK